MPYEEPERLVRVLAHHREDSGWTDNPLSREDFGDLDRSDGVFESLAAFTTGPRVLTGSGQAEELLVASVTTDFFRTLGVSAAIGRTITDVDVPGADQVVVLGDGFWRSHFGADRGVVGRAITLDGSAFTILGVMPPSLDYPLPETRVFIPVSLLGCDDINCSRAARFLNAVGRLAPGVSVEAASAATSTLFDELARAYPDTNENWTASVIPLRESLVGDVRPQLLILLGSVGFLLLITCANVANLLLARGAGRRREFAVQAALGAGRSRVARQILTESLVLATLGGGLGFVLAIRGVDLLVALGAGSIPRSHVIHTDLRLAAFALAASLTTGVLFGLLPSMTASRVHLHDDLRAAGRMGSARTRRETNRGLLVGVQAALAVILVTGATLLAKSFWNLTRVDTGFTAENVLSVTVRTDGDVTSGEERNAYRREMIRGIGELPGVIAVGGAKDLPLHGVTEAYSVALPELPDRPVHPQTVIVTGRYFEALGIPLLSGRFFTADDETDRTLVVIVDRALAQLHWPGGDAVGEAILVAGRVPVTIVGVVGDVRHAGITRVPAPTLYVLPHFGGRSNLTIFVRTASDPLPLADAVRRAVWDINPDQPAVVSTLSQVRSTTVAEPRFLTVLLGSFAGLAIVLAVLGVYGVTAYEASRRTYEIGVRMALGARAPDVLRLIVAEGIMPMVFGLMAGLVGALALSRTLTSLLYGVEATDPATFVAVPLLVTTLGLLAVYLPARRATRVDPRVALLAE
jgi:predicted permease